MSLEQHFADTAESDVEVLYTVQTAAKVLRAEGVDTGRRRLFDWFIEHDWCRHELSGHVPTAGALALGLLAVRPTTKPNGQVWDQLLVTPAGLVRLLDALTDESARTTTTNTDISRGNWE